MSNHVQPTLTHARFITTVSHPIEGMAFGLVLFWTVSAANQTLHAGDESNMPDAAHMVICCCCNTNLDRILGLAWLAMMGRI